MYVCMYTPSATAVLPTVVIQTNRLYFVPISAPLLRLEKDRRLEVPLTP